MLHQIPSCSQTVRLCFSFIQNQLVSENFSPPEMSPVMATTAQTPSVLWNSWMSTGPRPITITVNHWWTRLDSTSGVKPNTNFQMLQQSKESLFAWNKAGKHEYICTFILTIRSGLSGLLFRLNVKLHSYIDQSLKKQLEKVYLNDLEAQDEDLQLCMTKPHVACPTKKKNIFFKWLVLLPHTKR